MNIKNVNTAPILPIEPKKRIDGGVRTQNATDRDADGKQEKPEGEAKSKLTDEEFEQAFKTMKAMPGLKANDLSIRVDIVNGLRTIFIEDLNGKVIRRLTEGQLWLATRDKDKSTGTILDKAM